MRQEIELFLRRNIGRAHGRALVNGLAIAGITVAVIVLAAATYLSRRSPTLQGPQENAGVTPATAGNAFAEKIYTVQGRSRSIRIMSSTEIEFSEGHDHFVGTYTREGNRLRAVVERLGTRRSLYFTETDEGLKPESERVIFYTGPALKEIEDRIANERRIEQERRRKARLDQHVRIARAISAPDKRYEISLRSQVLVFDPQTSWFEAVFTSYDKHTGKFKGIITALNAQNPTSPEAFEGALTDERFWLESLEKKIRFDFVLSGGADALATEVQNKIVTINFGDHPLSGGPAEKRARENGAYENSAAKARKALEENNFEQAIESAKAALKVRPGASEMESILTTSRQKKEAQTAAASARAAHEAARAKKWADAITEARKARVHAQQSAEMDALLQSIHDSVMDEVRRLLANQRISENGAYTSLSDADASEAEQRLLQALLINPENSEAKALLPTLPEAVSGLYDGKTPAKNLLGEVAGANLEELRISKSEVSWRRIQKYAAFVQSYAIGEQSTFTGNAGEIKLVWLKIGNPQETDYNPEKEAKLVWSKRNNEIVVTLIAKDSVGQSVTIEFRRVPPLAPADVAKLNAALRRAVSAEAIYAGTARGTSTFSITFTGYDELTGRMSGLIYWPESQGIHRVEGRLKGSDMEFTEISYFKKGGGQLGIIHRLTYNSDDTMRGTFRLDPEATTEYPVFFSLKQVSHQRLQEAASKERNSRQK